MEGKKMTSIIAWTVAAAMMTACSAVPDTDNAPVTLENKTIAFVGDSICYGTNFKGGYAALIGEQENMIVTNAGLGGASVARGVKWSADSDGLRPSVIDMVEGLDGSYDYIIVEGGINDFWNHTPLGELMDSFEGDFDDTTFAGALEAVFSEIQKNHPESKAGYVIVHDPFTYDAEADFEKYYEMIKSACDKWSVAYLDLYAANNQTVGVNVRDAEQKKLYFESNDRPDGDGTHPNELGYQTIYVEPMVEWIKTL